MILVARIEEKRARENVAREFAAQDLQDVFIAIAIHIAQRDRTTFLQVSDSSAAGDVFEILPLQISQEPFRKKRAVIGGASGEIQIRPAIAVEIPRDTTAGVVNVIEPRLRRDVPKTRRIPFRAFVMIKPRQLRRVRLP